MYLFSFLSICVLGESTDLTLTEHAKSSNATQDVMIGGPLSFSKHENASKSLEEHSNSASSSVFGYPNSWDGHVMPRSVEEAKALDLMDINSRQTPVLDCRQWGGDCSKCSGCKKSHKKWNVEWWYYAIVPDADAIDKGDIEDTINESIGYIRGIAVYSAQNITNKHTLAGFRPTSDWPGINTSKPVQFYSGIQIHACVPLRGCYSILYELGANYTANDTHFRYWSEDIYVTNDTFKLNIPCGSFYNYNYATDNYDAPCADIEFHYVAAMDSQPKQKLTDAITDPVLDMGLASMGWFPESLSANTQGKAKIWNYKMPEDGYYGHGEIITLMDYGANTAFRAYYGHAFGARSGYDSGISNWLWLYAQNMTCANSQSCEFGNPLNIVVGGQFGPAVLVYVDGAALRGESFIGLDRPAQSDAKAVDLPEGGRAIQIKQGIQGIHHEGEFQFLCPAKRITPYSANKFTMHAMGCPAQITVRRRPVIPGSDTKSSTYTTNLGLVELDVSWLSKLGLQNDTTKGPYPMVPYDESMPEKLFI